MSLRAKRFCLLYAVCLNATKAYRMAYRSHGSEKTAASRLMQTKNVRKLIKLEYRKYNRKLVRQLEKE